MQSKRQSLIESVLGTLIGLIVSFGIQLVIYPALDIEVSVGQNVLITSIFFAISIIRSYFVRRMFNKLFRK